MVLEYFNITDGIVRESVKAVSEATTTPENSPIVVGGMAVQLYCINDKDLLRSTSDIDLLFLPQIDSYKTFSSGIGKDIVDSFKGTIYQVQLKKLRHRDKYVVKVMNGQGQKAKELFHMHVDKSEFNLEPRLKHLNEILASTAVEISHYDNPVFVPRVEFILARKINRIGKNLDCISPLERSVYSNLIQGKWSDAANLSLNPWLDYIVQRQNEITNEKNDVYHNYQANKDLYDLCLLSRQVEGKTGFFNRAFYSKAKEQVDNALRNS